MDGFEFASNVLGEVLDFAGKLAWPALVAYIAVTQREGIKRLLERMSKFKAGGMEAEFGAKTAAAAERIEERIAEPLDPPKLPADAPVLVQPNAVEGKPAEVDAESPSVTPNAFAKRYVERHAREAWLEDERLRASGQIIEAWAGFQESMRRLAISRGISGASTEPVSKLLAELNRMGVVTSTTLDSVKELQRLRNQVAHSDFEPTRPAADDFAVDCWKLQERILAENAAWLKALHAHQQAAR